MKDREFRAHSAVRQADQTVWPSPGFSCSRAAADRSPSGPVFERQCLMPQVAISKYCKTRNFS